MNKALMTQIERELAEFRPELARMNSGLNKLVRDLRDMNLVLVRHIAGREKTNA